MAEIEKGIPMPVKTYKSKFNFGDMEIGDSFFVSTENYIETASSAQYFGKVHNKKFSIRKIEDGYRLWRIK